MSCWRNARQLKRFYTRNAIVHSKSIKYIKQDVGGVLAAVAAVGAVGGVVKMYLDALPSSMRKEDAVLILHEMKLAAAEVADQLQQAKYYAVVQAEQKGEKLDKEAMHGELLKHFAKAMGAVSKEICKKMECTEEEIEKAMNRFHEEEEIQYAKMELDKTMENIMVALRADLPKVPESLTVDNFLNVLEQMMELQYKLLNQVLEESATEGVDISVPENWIPRFTEIFEGATEKLFEAHGLRKDMIGVAMIKFQDNAQFMERYMDMEKKQQERMNAVIEKYGQLKE